MMAAPFVGRQDPEEATSPPPAAARHLDHREVRVVPVPLADPAVADLLHPGDLVDLVGPADPDSPAGPAVVARAATIATPGRVMSGWCSASPGTPRLEKLASAPGLPLESSGFFAALVSLAVPAATERAHGEAL